MPIKSVKRKISKKTKQAQRRAAAETVARKLIEHLKHSMYYHLRHHNVRYV